MTPKMKVGRNIRINRERLGLTQKAPADRAGCRVGRGLRDMRVLYLGKSESSLVFPSPRPTSRRGGNSPNGPPGVDSS